MVERIINKVINDDVDIDKILIVTFTSAAASEMRERILEAIYKRIEEDPSNSHLQKQIILLNKSNISTIHSFCLDIIRNNFYEIDTSANFRVADTAEIELLKQEIMDDLFEEKYLDEDEGFEKLLDTYTDYRGDEDLRQLILNIYKFIQSSPFPEKWLNEQVEKFNLGNSLENDFSETVWGQILLENFKEDLTDYILKLKQLHKEISKYEELTKYQLLISEDIQNLEDIKNGAISWDDTYNKANLLEWGKWPSDKKITLDIKEKAHKTRDDIKLKVRGIIRKYFMYSSKQANSDVYEMYDILKLIKDFVIEFTNRFAIKKKEKNIIDFNDIEHFALNILLKTDDNGKIYETDVAKKYKEKFEEIAVDEYQDSNLVQEYILKSVSKGNNMFMVGDVKQSIYKFRQARPELFLEKYAMYKLKGDNISNGQKIQLFKNFRSRENVLDLTNLIFENIMSLNLGDICYDEKEFLNYGANYPEPEKSDVMKKDGELNKIEYKKWMDNLEDDEKKNDELDFGHKEIKNFAGIAELNIIDTKPPEADIYKDVDTKSQVDDDDLYISEDDTEDDEKSNESVENQEIIENVVLEAKYVAKKIKELVESNYMVFDKKSGYRKVTYKDIVILLRSTKTTAPIFEKEISNLNMPVFSDVSSEFLDSMEIQTIMSLLKIIDNPMQDIPLVTILRSSIGGFTDNELIEIRGNVKNISFYESLKNKYELLKNESEKISSNKNGLNEDDTQRNNLLNKMEIFFNNLKKWQDEEKYMELDELIWQIYSDTNFYNYVTLLPNGGLRQANLKMLFERAKQYESASFKGLFNFINFIDKVHSGSGDLSSAKLIGENENVIRIMSIHKSKGLEFPIVFLSCTSKQFNLQDLNDKIILHQDLGIGPNYINSDRKIQYTTLAKEAIKLKSKVETLSEEMRVLYVALTRAKEKLIITGVSKNLEKDFKEKENLIQLYKEDESSEINYVLLKRCKSYLDWIELVYFNNIKDIDKFLQVNIIKKSELLKILDNNELIEENIIKKINDRAKELDKSKIDELAKVLKWKYFYMASAVIPTKTSVTKLKDTENEQIVSIDEIEENKRRLSNDVGMSAELKTSEELDLQDEDTQESKFAVARPQFLNEEVKITNAQKGTLMHLCFQKLDERKEYTKEMLQQLVDDLVHRKIITPLEGKSINMYKLYSYTRSELFKQLKNAKKVYKEQPFYISLTANEIYGNGLEDNILVQGIIDLYFINQEGEVVLVDYKTDFVEKGNELALVEKYRKQLEIYKKAIEQALQRSVDKSYIYSVYLDKLIEI